MMGLPRKKTTRGTKQAFVYINTGKKRVKLFVGGSSTIDDSDEGTVISYLTELLLLIR